MIVYAVTRDELLMSIHYDYYYYATYVFIYFPDGTCRAFSNED